MIWRLFRLIRLVGESLSDGDLTLDELIDILEAIEELDGKDDLDIEDVLDELFDKFGFVNG